MTYVETSARASTKGVKDAFEVAALAALGKLNKQQMKQQVYNRFYYYKQHNITLILSSPSFSLTRWTAFQADSKVGT